MNNPIKIILNLFKKKKEQYPAHFLIVKLSPVAKSLGVNDEFNKEIHVVKNGIVVEIVPYTKKMIDSFKEIEELPIFEEDYDEDEEYEYDSFNELSSIRYKR